VTARLPLFPLNTVLFPGLVLPLTVFEERYRALVRDLLAQPQDEPRQFGVVAIRDGHEVAPSGPGVSQAGAAAGFGPDLGKALHTVGCTADVASLRAKDKGAGYELVATGTTRFRLLSIDSTGEYLVGEVEELPEEQGTGAGPLTAEVERAFRTYQKQLAGAQERTLAPAQQLPDQPSVLSYLVAAAMVAETPVKQRLLETVDTATRLADELRLLRREAAVIGRLPSLPAVDLTQQRTSHN
jgi:uncharacterized protein